MILATGLRGNGVSFVVGELVIGDNGSVFVFALGHSKIHAYAFSVYIQQCQAIHAYFVCLQVLGIVKKLTD